ncbi:uroporphyrinogen-III synthase [Porticoccus sp.]
MLPGRKPLRVLLLRPLQQRDDFIAALSSRCDVELYRCPVMDIVPLDSTSDSESIQSRMLNFDHFQIAIFVSRTAANLAVEWLNRCWPALPPGVRYYAVGNATASVLQAQRIAVETPSQSFDSEGLLKLPSLQSVAGEKALIFAGRGGRTLLAEELERRGARVSRCDLYERRPSMEYASQINVLLSDSAVDMVVAHSGELLELLLQLVAPACRQPLMSLPVLVPGQRVAELAVGQGFTEVISATSALPSDMVSAILEWYSNSG